MPTSESSAGRFEVMVLPGVPRVVAGVRGCLRDLLGSDHARLDDVLLCSSELLGNALRHSASGADGGRIRIEVMRGEREVRVAVIDDGGSDTRPRIVEAGDGETGRGLRLVAELSDEWESNGVRRGPASGSPPADTARDGRPVRARSSEADDRRPPAPRILSGTEYLR